MFGVHLCAGPRLMSECCMSLNTTFSYQLYLVWRAEHWQHDFSLIPLCTDRWTQNNGWLNFSMDSNFLHRGGVKKLEEIIWQSALFILKISYSPWNPNQSPKLILYTLRMAMAPVLSNSRATLMNRSLNEETCPGCDLLSPHWRWDKM